jgi:mono/diheme cytochrome c family protein
MKAGFGLVLLAVLPVAAAPETSAPQFQRDVLPILQKSCVACHGPKARMAGLDLHEASLALRGGENGPVVTPGKPAESMLLKRVREGSMPPGGKNRLSDTEVATIERWISAGAPGSTAPAPEPAYISTVTAKDRQFWSFRTLQKTTAPKVRQATLVKTPVDAFLLAKLESKKLTYAREAARATLARRAYLDLTGLPPGPADVDAFAADKSPGAFAALVDRLLASPQFGERWGRHWLDLAGYVDTVGRDVQSNGYKVGDGRWKYRDYVVNAFNADKSFQQFLTEQIAGDELFDWRNAKRYTPDQVEKLIATGYLRTAEDPTDNSERDTPLLRYEVIHQTLDILTSSVMGVTVGCARCHNHKFDAIPQKDYYSLMATLTAAYNPVKWTPVLERTLANVAPAEKKAIDDHNAALDKAIEPKKAVLSKLYEKFSLPLIEQAIGKVDPKDRAVAKKAALLPEAKRNMRQKNLVAALGVDLSPKAILGRMSGEERHTVEALEAEIAALGNQRKSYDTLEALFEQGPPPETYIHRRGDHESKGPVVAPAGLEVLSRPGEILERPTSWSSGRRLALAEWLTREGTPAASLIARVYVNRVWMHLFGAGIVSTADNFGTMGSLPTHPELLEYLAGEFIRNGWSTKKLIREMMLSRAYRQSSLAADFPKTAALADPQIADPDNSLLWHMRLRRLESEVIRDSMLAVTGKLNPKIGGRPVPTITENDGMVVIDEKKLEDASDRFRRSMYLVARRRYNLSMLGVFDHPVMSTNAKERGASAVVLQSLMMMNDKEVLTQAGYFADRVLAGTGSGAADRVLLDAAYRYALGRTPDKAEATTLSGLLQRERDRFRQAGMPDEKAARESMASVCHVLLNANEFLYVE